MSPAYLTPSQLEAWVEEALEADAQPFLHLLKIGLTPLPGWVRLRIAAGRFLLERGTPHRALPHLRYGTDQVPWEGAFWAWRGLAEAAVHGAEAGVRALRRALAWHPDDPLAREGLEELGGPVEPDLPARALTAFYLRQGFWEGVLREALPHGEAHPDLALAAAAAAWALGDLSRCQALLEALPPSLPSLFLQAALAWTAGEESRARHLLRKVRRRDPAGSLLRRLLELAPPDLLALWDLTALPPLPAPSQPVTVPSKGPSGDTPPSPPSPEPELRPLLEVRRRLSRARPLPPLAPPTGKGRRPAYLILTRRTPLVARYGEAGANRVQILAEQLALALRERGVEAFFVPLDRPRVLEAFGLRPELREPPWRTAHRLRRALRRHGLEVRYLLLVGDEGVLPRPVLPNPSDDLDPGVPSDLPYGEEDPALPLLGEVAVGRMPDGRGDLETLLAQLERALHHHLGIDPPAERPGCLGALGLLPSPPASSPWAWVAQVWTTPSRLLLPERGRGWTLLTAPPYDPGTLPWERLLGAPGAHLNLHGTPEAPDWYGEAQNGAAFPKALTPALATLVAPPGGVVLSEACYGGRTADRTAATSIPLAFLASGAAGVIASTTLAYGGTGSRLTAADLLAYHLWNALLEGWTLGEALLQAQRRYLEAVYRHQGFADGDDLKTLLSFQLYGDPASRPLTPAAPPSEPPRLRAFPGPYLRPGRPVAALASELRLRAWRWLARWIPALRPEEVRAHLWTPSTWPGSGEGSPSPHPEGGEATAHLAFSAWTWIRTGDGTPIPRVARLLVDPQGRPVKGVVSR